MSQKICFINRSAIHYRKEIYQDMDKELGIEFYFGDSRPGSIKEFDYSTLINFKGLLHNINLGPFYWQKGLVTFLWKDYTDIIITGDTYCVNFWIFLVLSVFTKKRIHLWTHGAYGDEGSLKKFIMKMKFKLATTALLYGEYAKNIITKWAVNPNKLFLVYNSLSYDEQIQLRKTIKATNVYTEHFKNENYNLIFTGRLTMAKKLDYIVEAIALLKERGEDCNVTFVGDGPMKEIIEKKAEEKGFSNNVWLYGACYDEKILSELIYNADLCVSPGFVGLTAMHAMTFGTPVISHDNFPKQAPEFEAIEKGETGDFFKENDVVSLTDTIQKWIEEHQDRNATRKKCYRVIDEKYNPHRQIDTIRKALDYNA